MDKKIKKYQLTFTDYMLLSTLENKCHLCNKKIVGSCETCYKKFCNICNVFYKSESILKSHCLKYHNEQYCIKCNRLTKEYFNHKLNCNET